MTELLNDDVDICVDCYSDHHEGRAMKDGSVSWTDNTNANDDDGETGITDFSSSACQCCGSHLAGSRYRMAIWALPTTPVAFRADKHGEHKGQVTAVFSGVPGTRNGGDLTCYAHLGQHGTCTRGWYATTRPATPEEYAPLLAELTNQIGYNVTVVARVKWSA